MSNFDISISYIELHISISSIELDIRYQGYHLSNSIFRNNLSNSKFRYLISNSIFRYHLLNPIFRYHLSNWIFRYHIPGIELRCIESSIRYPTLQQYVYILPPTLTSSAPNMWPDVIHSELAFFPDSATWSPTRTASPDSTTITYNVWYKLTHTLRRAENKRGMTSAPLTSAVVLRLPPRYISQY